MWRSRILASLGLLGASIVHASSDNQLTDMTPRDNSQNCDCYLVSGADAGYFQYYYFLDFRSVPNDGDNDYTSPPPLVTASENNGGQNVTSAFFNTAQFNKAWSIEDGVEPAEGDATVAYVNSAQNVFISQDTDTQSTYLTLRAFRLQDFASTAEMDSNQKNVLHGSFRARTRVIPDYSDDPPVAPGAVLGFFTYHSDTEESDLEILTYDPTTNIRYSNQPDEDTETGNTIPGASTDAVLPNNKVWTDWHDHRLDWFDGMSRWYIDDELALEKTKNVPTKPSGLILNLWSDGGEWSGNMTVGAEVVAGFEWVEMVFNISGTNPSKRDQAACNVGCNVDGVQEVGVPEVAFDSMSSDSTSDDSTNDDSTNDDSTSNDSTSSNSLSSGSSAMVAGGVVDQVAAVVVVQVLAFWALFFFGSN